MFVKFETVAITPISWLEVKNNISLSFPRVIKETIVCSTFVMPLRFEPNSITSSFFKINPSSITSLYLDGARIIVNISETQPRILNGGSPEEARTHLLRIVNQINNSNEISMLRESVAQLQETVNEQQETIEWLRQSILYAPGGPMYQEAHSDFITHQQTI